MADPPAATAFQFYPQPDFYPAPEPATTVADEFEGILVILGRLLQTLVLTMIVLMLSAVSYAAVYTAIMPGPTTVVPLFFDYTGTPAPYPSHEPQWDFYAATTGTTQHGRSSHNKQHEQRQQLLNDRHVPQQPAAPWAAVDLFARHSPWESNGRLVMQSSTSGDISVDTMDNSVVPPPRTETRLLVSRQAYFIEIRLELPETLLNQQLGMFGVAVELQSSGRMDTASSSTDDDDDDDDTTSNNNNKTTPTAPTTVTLARSHRPVRFPHQTDWIRTLQKILTVVPLLLGAWEESRTVTIPSFRHFVESKNYPLRYVIVRIVPQPSATTFAEVSRGELRIGKELNLVQEILQHWYFTCFTMGTLVFATFYFSVGSVLWQAFRQRQERLRRDLLDEEEEPPCELNFDNDDDDIDAYLFEDLSFGPPPPSTEGGGRRQEGGVGSNNSTGSDARRRRRDAPQQVGDAGNGEWEDIFYDSTAAVTGNDETRADPAEGDAGPVPSSATVQQTESGVNS